MARTADHDSRRRQVADALLRTVAAHGVAGTKLVTVADEAGVSVGLVQSYFRSKTQLLRFAVESLLGRINDRLDGIEVRQPLRGTLQQLAETLLPLDDQRRDEAAVWLAFLPGTLTDPELKQLHDDAVDRQITGLVQGFAGAQKLGELPESLDPLQEALTLTAFVDGLANHMLTQPQHFGPAAGRRLTTAYFDRLFSHTKGET
ncbi:TetR/AcrR family transcriptional regulator [Lentzea californiensis]|uniref:TetR/AcrR family transcriptional regulator n=1 Tax=Lentzea californiensis TaxID=438851 RepID=UPI002165B703|nr:TetR family transcriptional regulator C-terminal domain-containing protein [Lentzea californiensis]MCR3753211.1 transcriptional regulator, TetR family [Lentzea californiensis]